MVDIGAKPNIMTKSAVMKLGQKYNLINAQLRIFNTLMIPLYGVAEGVYIVLG